MFELDKRKGTDLLIEHFWRRGYLTLSRRFGTYLPEPERIHGIDVDVVARMKDNYAIGLTVTQDEMQDEKLLEKIQILASRHTRSGNKKVNLFIGVVKDHYKTLKALVESLEDEVKKNVKIFPIIDKIKKERREKRRFQTPLFS